MKDIPAAQWQSYASQLAKLSFKGHSDYRLPQSCAYAMIVRVPRSNCLENKAPVGWARGEADSHLLPLYPSSLHLVPTYG